MHMAIDSEFQLFRKFSAILAFALVVFCGAAQAQQSASPLAGKTVHVYNPFGASLPQIHLSGVGYTMTPEAGNWYRFEFGSIGLQDWMNTFGIRTGNWDWLTPTGLGKNEALFPLSVFGTGKEVWIVVDPAGPPTAAPLILTSGPRRIYFFNPWPVIGADLMLNGTKRTLFSDKNHCGWNVYDILAAGPASGYFVNSADGETFGKAGLKDPTPMDFAALFSANGSEVWIGGTPMVSASFPGDLGSCSYLMATTVHDMAESHPDFSVGWNITGGVEQTLGPDRKPIGTSLVPANFKTWFNSNPNAAMPLKGAETCLDLEMSKSDDGLWEFDSDKGPYPSKEFFPIDQWNLLDQNSTCSEEVPPPASSVHNYGFCLESHANFVYKKGQVFDFRGDDDVWVFVNNKLALDLGGIHGATPGSINLDTLGLVEGQTYPWDFFFCERNKCGSSLRIKTTIYFKQQRALDHAMEKRPDGTPFYKVIKRIGGTGACGSSGDSIKEVAPGPLGFVLYRVGGDSIQTLPKGLSFGGITVADGGVSVDTAKVTGLAPGAYKVVFFETSNPNLRDEIRFTVSARNMVLFEAPLKQSTVLGNGLRVTAGLYFQGAGKDSSVADTATWSPTFPSTLSVYHDSLKTKPITSGSSLQMGATGRDTLWVFGNPASLNDQTDTLSIPGSNKSVVTFSLPPLDLPRAQTAEMFDDDADGRGDRLQVTYDRNLTGNVPVSVAYQWPVNGAAVAVTDLVSHLQGGDTLVFKGSPFTTVVQTEGSGTFKSTYKARTKDSTQILTIIDRIAPVIASASIHGNDAGKIDTLRLTFSEVISTASRNAAAQLMFSYKMGDSGTAISVVPSQTLWAADGLSVILLFPSDALPKPKAGDSVRLNGGTGLASDALGNTPGANSRFRIISGEKRTGIQTITLHHIFPELQPTSTPTFVVTREGTGASIEEAIAKTKRIGVLVEADLADFATGDGFNPPPPSAVKLEYEWSIFTNLGVPVASEKRSLACDSDLYRNDCRANRGRIFVGWNAIAKSGEKAATGVYIMLFQYRIVSAGQVLTTNAIRQRWGLVRDR
jgi:fibro-slime domain-containing protein